MPPYHARSNVCRAGVTYSGLATRSFGLAVAGVDRTADAQAHTNFTLTRVLDGSAALSLTFSGTAPSEGQDLVLTLGGELLFGGTVQRVRSVSTGQIVKWETVCTDWWWLLTRYARVTGRFVGGVNTVVARLLAGFSDGGFLPGYLPQSLGDVDITFEDESVGDALKRIAKAANNGAGAFLRLTPYKRIDIATSFPDGVSLSVSNTTRATVLTYERLLDQIRTRVQARGRGTQTTTGVSPTQSSLPVAELGIFPAAGGTVWVPAIGPVTFTGKTAASGPGDLTGVAGLSADVPQGTLVQVYAVADDAAAQADLAARLGGGRSGVAIHSMDNDAWSQTEAAAMAGAHLALLKAPQAVLGVTYEHAQARTAAQVQRFEVGAVVSVNTTSPQLIATSFRLQRTTVTAFSSLAESEPRFTLSYDARSTVGVDLFDLLGTLS